MFCLHPCGMSWVHVAEISLLLIYSLIWAWARLCAWPYGLGFPRTPYRWCIQGERVAVRHGLRSTWCRLSCVYVTCLGLWGVIGGYDQIALYEFRMESSKVSMSSDSVGSSKTYSSSSMRSMGWSWRLDGICRCISMMRPFFYVNLLEKIRRGKTNKLSTTLKPA